MIYACSRALLVRHASGRLYSAWVYDTTRAAECVRRAVRRNGPAASAIVVDETRLSIASAGDWERVTPELAEAAGALVERLV